MARKKEPREDAPRRLEILAAAADLFRKKGYRSTNMSLIAQAVGIDQSSLYYWYKNKEAIMFALLEKAVRDDAPYLETVRLMGGAEGEAIGSPELRLYCVLYTHTLLTCSFPCDCHALEDLAQIHPKEMKSFVQTNDLFYQAGCFLLQNCSQLNKVVNDSVPYTADFTLALVEAAQHRWHLRLLESFKGRGADEGAFRPVTPPTVFEEARFTACIALRTVKPDADARELHAQAAALGLIRTEQRCTRPDLSEEAVRAYYSGKQFEYGWASLCKMTLPPNLEGKNVLDIGCRRGKGVYKLGDRVGARGQAAGVDWSESYIAEARSGISRAMRVSSPDESNVRFYAAYPEDLAAAGIESASMDMVFINSVVNLVFDRQMVLQEIYRVLKPGGLLVCETVTADTPRDGAVVEQARAMGNSVQAAPFRLAFEEELARAGFKNLTFEDQHRVAASDGFKAGYTVDVVETKTEAPEYTAAVVHAVK